MEWLILSVEDLVRQLIESFGLFIFFWLVFKLARGPQVPWAIVWKNRIWNWALDLVP